MQKARKRHNQMRVSPLFTGLASMRAFVRSILSVCAVLALLSVFSTVFFPAARAQSDIDYVIGGGVTTPDQPRYGLSGLSPAGDTALTGAAGARQACALFQQQGLTALQNAMDARFQNRSLLSGFSDSKLGSMVYAQGNGALGNALNASCAALTGTGGDAVVSGFDADVLKDMAYMAAFGEGLGFLQSSGLPFTGRLEVTGSLFGRGASGFEILTVQPLWHDATEQNHIFTQVSWNRTIGRKGYVDGDVYNAGLAWRRLSEDRSVVYGLNAFLDHAPDMNHNRASIGADVQTAQLGVSANKYIPLSSWKSVDAYKEERASSGFDLELQGRLPELPSWQLNLKGFQWSSNEDMERETTWGYDAGLQWQPVNALVWEAGLRNEQDASPQFHTALRMVYKFGEPLEKMWERPVAITDMRERVYDKVRRDNAMRIEQRVKDSAYVTVTQTVGANTALLETGAVALSVGQQLPRPFTITTAAAPGSVARLTFRDGAVLTIGAGSQVRVEADVITLISGLFQYVSGSTNVTINIPGGTVTLLGTDIDVSSNGATSVLRVRDGSARLDGTSSGSVTLGVAQAAASVSGVVGGALADADPVYIAHVDDVSEKIDRTASPLTGPKVAPYPYKAPEITEAGDTVGDTIKIGVTFSTNVSVSGTPQLAFTINGNDRMAAYSASDSTAAQLVFVYTLLLADAGATTLTTHSIDLNGGAIAGEGKDAVTTMADTALNLSGPINPGQDDTPDAFVFTDVTNQPLGTVIVSNIVQVTGIGPNPVAVGITGGAFRICGTGDATCAGAPVQDWGSANQTISDGEYLQLRLTSSGAVSTLASATVTVGTASDQWDVTTGTDLCSAPSPAPGTTCADGTLFAGFHPVTGVKFYAMQVDAANTMSWNKYQGTATADTINLPGSPGGPMDNCPAINDSGTYTTGVRSRDPVHPHPLSADPNKAVVTAGCHEGKAMSEYLAGVTNASSPYEAATYCANLAPGNDAARALGYDDWYLPSINELSVMFVNLGPQPNNNFQNAYYWSSSESNTTSAWGQYFSTGSQSGNSKYGLRRVRCIRQ